MNKVAETQKEQVKRHLLRGETLTTLEALKLYNSFRLSSIIHRLRKEGVIIYTRTLRTLDGKLIAEYYIPRNYIRHAMFPESKKESNS